MPGLSSARPLRGANGIGTINIKFRPRRKTPLVGLYFFLFGLSLLLFQYLWSKPNLRVKVVTPVLRAVFVRFDYMRWAIGSKLWGGERDLFNKRWVSSDTILGDVPGLKGDKANISRDIITGAVTLSAKSAVDAVFAQGYAHAMDRLYQLDMSRRRAQGTVSEVLGEDYVVWDKAARVTNIHSLAKRDWQRLSAAADAETKNKNKNGGEQNRRQVALLTSYAAGINAYLDENPVMPIEFYVYYGSMHSFFFNWGKAPKMKAWTPVDSLAILRMFAFESNQGWEKEYLKSVLLETIGPEAVDLLLPPASNQHAKKEGDIIRLKSTTGTAWAVTSGEKAPILGSDLQSPMESHNRWYFNELRWTQFGSDDVANIITGASMPGIPLVMQGRNDYLSWGWAVSDTDSEDLFVERLVQGPDGEMFAKLTDDKIDPVAVRIEEIKYFDKGGKPRHLEMRVMDTRRGPVVNELIQASFPGLSKKYDMPGISSPQSGSPLDSFSESMQTSLRFANLSLSSQALRQPVDLSFFLTLSTARGWADFRKACDSLSVVPLHVLYADRRGNTGFATTGAKVERRGVSDGTLPTSGIGWNEESSKKGSGPSRLFSNGQSIIASTESVASPDSDIASLLGITGDSSRSHDNVVARALSVMDSAKSPSSVKFAAIIAAHKHFPASSHSFKRLTEDEITGTSIIAEDARKIRGVQEVLEAAVGADFDGLYNEEANAPTLIEAFRQTLAEKVLGPNLLPLQGYLRGAPLTAGFPRDPRNTALLWDHTWLFRLLKDTEQSDNDEIDGWLASQGMNTDGVVREALLAVSSWMDKTGVGVDAGGSSSANSLGWGRHHLSMHSHFIRRHTIQHSVMSPPPLPLPGGADDCFFRSPYSTRGDSFQIHARSSPQYSKKGGKGELVTPFRCCGEGQFMSSMRLVSDLTRSVSSDSAGIWWSMGSSVAYHGQTQPDYDILGLFSGSFSLSSEILTSAISLVYSSLFQSKKLFVGSGSSPSTTDTNLSKRGGPSPWLAKIQPEDGGGGISVVRLLKSSFSKHPSSEL